MTRSFAAAAVVAAALCGCSPFPSGSNSGGYGSNSGRSSATSTSTPSSAVSAQAAKLRQAERTHEYPGPPQHQTARGGSPDPLVAVDVFATGYINWTASTVSSRMHALATLSVGQARSEVLLAAVQTAQDYELRRGGIANTGTVEAVAPMLGVRDQYAVVTRELTTAANTTAYQGLRPAWHIALATVTQLQGGGWVLSAWQPEN